MSYLGQVELKSSEIRRVDVTGSTSATHTLTWTPASEQSLIITINGIKQQNNYSISGTTLTLDDALLSDDKMEVIGILDIGEAVIPPDDSITTAMVKDDAIDADKLANSINTEITANTAKVTNATHTGDVTGATALTIAADAVTPAKMADSAYLANRNYIINGDFDVWQRGTSFTISSAGPGEYNADRWKFEGNNFSGSLTRQSFATNQTDVPNCPAYYVRWINSTTMGAGEKVQFLQPIELKPNGFKLANQEVTFSCWLKSVSGTIPDGNIKLIKESAVYPSVGAIGTTWTKFTHTWTVWNSTQGYMWIGFECPATYSLTNGLDIAHCQLEIGDTATPFEYKTFGQEFADCCRYYQNSYTGVTPDTAPTRKDCWTTTSWNDGNVNFPVFPYVMRSAPSVVLRNNGNLTAGKCNSNGTERAAVANEIGIKLVSYITVTSGTANAWTLFSWELDAELGT